MQKIVQFGKVQQQTPPLPPIKPCPNCVKLQAQIADLNNLLQQRDNAHQNDSDSEDYDKINIKTQLLNIRQKYETLKKTMQKIQQQNDDLFMRNTQLEKKLSVCTLQLKEHSEHQKQTQKIEIATPAKRVDERSNEKYGFEDRQTEKKELQVLLFVERQKVTSLQTLTKNQSDEIVKLRQFLRKRNNLQAQRHRLLEQLQSQCQSVN